jgi:hypothetical protein
MYQYIVRQMIPIIEKKGYRVMHHTLSGVNPYSTLARRINQVRSDICLLFSMDAVGFEIQSTIEDRWINTMSCPCVTHLLKHPVCLPYNLRREWSWNVVVQTSEQEGHSYMERHYQKYLESFLTPHIAWDTIETEEKEYDWYVPGDYTPLPVYEEQIHQMPDVFEKMAYQIRDLLRRGEDVTLETAMMKVCAEVGLVLAEEEIDVLLTQMLVVAEYVQMEKIQDTVTLLLEQGASVSVCGKSWEQFPHTTNPLTNLSGGQQVPAEEIARQIARSRKILFPCTNGFTWEQQWLATAYTSGVTCIRRYGEGITQEWSVPCLTLEEYMEQLLHLEED